MRRALAFVVLASLAGVSAWGQQGMTRSPERVQLEAAINKEIIDGDLAGAMAVYRSLVESSDRSVKAHALLRLGQVYARLGDPQATATLERVLEFTDQPELAAAARNRLAATGDSRISEGRVWAPGQNRSVRAVSPDGRIVAFGQDGDLYLYQVTSKSERRVTNAARRSPQNPAENQGLNDGVAFSRDGRQVAYHWFRASAPGVPLPEAELRVVSLGGTGVPESKVIFANVGIEWIRPFDWTPDGSAIVVGMFKSDLTFQIGVISVKDGALRILKSVAWDRAQSMSVSPDGKFLAIDLPSSDTDRKSDVFVLALDASREVRVAPSRSHDLLVGWSTDGGHLLFQSDRTGAPGLWAVAMSRGQAEGEPFLVKSGLAPVQHFGIGSGKFFYQLGGRPNPLEIRIASIDFAKGTLVETVVPGQDPTRNYSDAAWSPDGRYLAFLSEPRTAPGLSIVVRDMDTQQVVQVLEPALDSVANLRWAPDGKSLAALVSVRGRYSISQIDLRTAAVTTIVANPIGGMLFIRGPEWSADGTKIYYRHRRGTGPAHEALVEHDLKSHQERDVYVSPKGVIGTAKSSPDGRTIAISIPTGNLLVSLATGEVRDLLTPGGGVLGWSSDSSTVFLSRGRFPNEVDIVRVPAAGGAPMVGPRLPRGWGLATDRAGSRVALFTADDVALRPVEIWALDNVMPALKASR